MNIDRRQLITSKQLMVIIISSMTSVGIISIPYLLAKHVGHDGWIPLVLSCIVSIIMAVIIVNLLKRYKNKSIFDINLLLYGKYLGAAINIIYLLYLLTKLSIYVRIISEIIHDIVLRFTPLIVIYILVLICPVYIAWYGLKPISRYANLIYLAIFSVLLLFVLELKHTKFTFLLPVGECDMSSILRSMELTSSSFLALAFPWVLYPMITDKEKVLKYTIEALLISTAFFIMVTVFTTAYFGEKMLIHLSYPLYSLARSYKAPIVERLDLFFLAMWFPTMEITVKTYLFTPFFWTNQLFKIKKPTISLIIFTLVVIVMTSIPKDMTQVHEYLKIADIVGISLIILIAVAGYILSFINTKGVQKK